MAGSFVYYGAGGGAYEKCMVLELERACYNEMERESMEYFYAAEKELQRQRERIRQLENILTENGIPVPEES